MMFIFVIYTILICISSIPWALSASILSTTSTHPDLESLLQIKNLTELVSLCYSNPPPSSHFQGIPSTFPPSLLPSQPLIHRSSVRPLTQSEHQSLSLMSTLTAAAQSSSVRHQALTQHDLQILNITDDTSSSPSVPSLHPPTCGPFDTEHIPVLLQPLTPSSSPLSHASSDSPHPASAACRLLQHLLTTALPWQAEEHHTHPRFIVSPLPAPHTPTQHAHASPHSLSAVPPHEHSPAPPADPRAQVTHLHRLASASVPLLEQLVGTLRRALGSYSKWGVKHVDKILEKSTRAEILAEKPWYSVQHLRDVLRFKARLKDLDALKKLLNVFLLSGVQVVGFDAYKFIFSKGYGWRPVCIDLRFPNGLLVEFYAVPLDMDVKAVKHRNHEIYEAWRTVDTAALKRDFRRWRHSHPSAWGHDWIRFENARFTSQVRYSNALWRWYRRQGLDSYVEMRRRYLSIVHAVNRCESQHEQHGRGAEHVSGMGAGEVMIQVPHSHPLPAMGLATGCEMAHQPHLGLFRELVAEWVAEEAQRRPSCPVRDEDKDLCPAEHSGADAASRPHLGVLRVAAAALEAAWRRVAGARDIGGVSTIKRITVDVSDMVKKMGIDLLSPIFESLV